MNRVTKAETTPDAPLKSTATRSTAKRSLRVFTYVLALAVGLTGCGRPAPEAPDPIQGKPEQVAELPGTPPQDYLRQVFGRYRGARRYSDRGEVRLSIKHNGRVVQQTAPMEVILDGSDVWVAAYDGRLWSTSQSTIGYVVEQVDRPEGSQVLVGSRGTPDDRLRPQLERLLSDPVLTSHITSGLGGPPPQLEWLLAANPMAKLFAGDAKPTIRYEPKLANRAGALCVGVSVTVEGDTYRFWIDRAKSMIVSIDLPVSLAGQQLMAAGGVVESLELRLVDAGFHADELPERAKSDFPARPIYVRSLVPLPPARPNRFLGQFVSDFERVDTTGDVRVSPRDQRTTFTLFCSATLASLPPSIAVVQTIPRAILQQTRVVLLVDQESEAAGRDLGWVMVRDEDRSLTGRLGISAGELALLSRDGKLIWSGSPRASTEISAVATDSLAGIDVTKRMWDLWTADQQAYEKALADVRLSE